MNHSHDDNSVIYYLNLFPLKCEFAGFISSWNGNSAIGNSTTGNLSYLMGSRRFIRTSPPLESEIPRPSESMATVRGILGQDGTKDSFIGYQFVNHSFEEKLDVVHIKLVKNNTFVTITDSNGKKKAGASSGCLGGTKTGKVSRYASEATAEHVGRLARKLGLKSVVMRVNGFVHFKKKKQAILGWKEGYTYGKGDRTPIAYIEDTTRRAHNGCRLPKKRRS